MNVRVPRFQPRLKYIRDEKHLNIEQYVSDISDLPFSLIYAFDDVETKLDIFNSLIFDCINKHTLLKNKATRPPSLWIQSEKTRIFQQEGNNLHYVAHKHKDHSKWNQFREKRNDVKKEIRYEKAKFYRKALSSNKPKEVWKAISSILNPPPKPKSIKPDTMNNYFVNLAKQTVKKDPVSAEDIEKLITQMSTNSDGFKMKKVQYSNVVKELTSFRNDISNESDEIPTKFIKPISDVIASPFTDIISTMIETSMLP